MSVKVPMAFLFVPARLSTTKYAAGTITPAAYEALVQSTMSWFAELESLSG